MSCCQFFLRDVVLRDLPFVLSAFFLLAFGADFLGSAIGEEAFLLRLRRSFAVLPLGMS